MQGGDPGSILDPGATKPVCHNYQACAIEPIKAANRRRRRKEKPLLNADERKPAHSDEDQCSPAKKEMQYRNHSAKTGAEDSLEPSGWLSTTHSQWAGVAAGCYEGFRVPGP